MTSTGFGWLKYNNKIYEHDILVISDGKVIPRNEDMLRKKFGTCHAIGIDELKILLQGSPEVIVIGTGQNGEARLTQEAKEFITRSHARIMEGSTPKACKKFDEITAKKAALFHVTC